MTIALTTMAAISLAILVYIAVVITGTYTTQNISSSNPKTSLAEEARLDSAKSQQIASSLDYVHKSDINIAPLAIPLHGVNLTANQFILLYDSTPYASKGPNFDGYLRHHARSQRFPALAELAEA